MEDIDKDIGVLERAISKDHNRLSKIGSNGTSKSYVKLRFRPSEKVIFSETLRNGVEYLQIKKELSKSPRKPVEPIKCHTRRCF